MKLFSQRCPQCGGNTRKTGKRERYCDFCKTSFFVDKENKKIINKNTTINNYYGNTVTRAVSKKQISIVVLVMVPIIILTIGMLKNLATPSQLDQTTKHFLGRKMPQSSGVKEIAHQIFGKKIDEITTDDLKKVTFLSIDKTGLNKGNYWKISYSQLPYNGNQPSDIKTIQFSGGKNIDAADITVFKNLQYLNFNQNSDIQTNDSIYDFSSLTKLKFYGGWINQPCSDALDLLKSNDALEEISVQIRSGSDIDKLSKLKHLRSLDVTNISSQKYTLNDKIDLNKLRSIKNLNKLSIYLPQSEDLLWLASLNQLNSLAIKLSSQGEQISDFSSLYGLSQLETLEITDASGLKDISFTKNMPKLKNLSLDSTEVRDLSALNNRTSIISLSLVHNYKIDNFSPIETLSSLSKIKIEFGQYDKVNSSQFQSLDNLKSVETREGYLPAFTGNTSIEDLTITGDVDLEPSLQTLLGLKKISIDDALSAQNIGILKGIGIVDLEFHNTYVKVYNSEDYEALFLHPSLQKLSSSNGDLFVYGFNIKPEPNSIIKSIVFKGDKRLYEQKNLFLNQIPYYTNLDNLTLTDCDLDNLSFLGRLNQLQNLDLSDNRITDVSPIVKLTQLKRINLTNNPIQNVDLLKEYIVFK